MKRVSTILIFAFALALGVQAIALAEARFLGILENAKSYSADLESEDVFFPFNL